MRSSRSWAAALLLLGCSAEVIAQEVLLDQQVIYEAVNSSTINCKKACISLQNLIGPQIVYHGAPPGFNEQFFSKQQQQQNPTCVVVPETAEQVAQALPVVNEHDCQFVVKSGGHSTYAGGSNIDNGLVFDMHNFRSVDISEDETTVSVGTANKWVDVYTTLEEKGLTAVGGRVASVGVGGFLLGGGISLHFRKYGWGVKSVRNFETVLADGTITNVNAESHPDLFWALQGGGHNFGIVTRFDLETYRQPPLWAGTDVNALSDMTSRRAALNLTDPFEWTLQSARTQFGTKFLNRVLCLFGKCSNSRDYIDFMVKMAHESDPNVHIYFFVAWFPPLGMYGAGSTYAYLEPPTEEGSIPRAFESLSTLNPFSSSGRIANVSDVVIEVDAQNKYNYRQYWVSVTLKVDADLISELWDIFLVESEELKDMYDCQPAVNFQLLSKSALEASERNGGTPMGLKPEDGPLFLFSITTSYPDPADDEKVKAILDRLLSRATALAKERDLYHPFVYKNYVGIGPDVYAGYGVENRQKLQGIQKKYDPEGVFSRLQPGIHKV